MKETEILSHTLVKRYCYYLDIILNGLKVFQRYYLFLLTELHLLFAAHNSPMPIRFIIGYVYNYSFAIFLKNRSMVFVFTTFIVAAPSPTFTSLNNLLMPLAVTLL